MELKLLLVIFIFRVSTRATIETEIVEEKEDQHLMNEALYNDDVQNEDFLDGIDGDLDYFYTYEAIKNLQMMMPKADKESNATVDMAEKFFLNFLTEDEYEEEYEYEDAVMDELAGSEVTDSDSYSYTELDEIDHDDFLYFDTLEDFVGQSSAGSPLSRDTILMLILAAVVVLVLVFLLLLLLLLYLRSRRQQSETGSQAEEEETQVVGDDNLLREIV